MAYLRDIGERTLIRNMMNRIRPAGPYGPGDDAAVLTLRGDTVLSTDVVTFARHMPPGMTFEEFGWMAAAVNFSDIAGMGAEPVGILVSFAMPDDLDETSLYAMMDGIDQCAEFCDTVIVGGDTKAGEGMICCTAVGDTCGRPPLTRSGARPGDIVAVTGTLGSAAAGFYAIRNGIREDEAVRSLKVPIPRIREGLILSKACATSCMDISDGLSTTVSEVCARSNVGMDILWESLPVGAGVDDMSRVVPKEHMMLDFGGEYELMFTFDRERIDVLYEKGLDFTVIGMVNDSGRANILKDGSIMEIQNGGYEHFKN